MAIVLNRHTFFDAQTVSAVSPWYPVDFRYAQIEQRSIMGTKTGDADSVVVEVRILNDTVQVIATATTFAGSAGSFSAVLYGAFDAVRVRKVGSSAAATVLGIV